MCIYQTDESNFLTKIYERKNLMDYMLFYEQLFCKQYQDEIGKKKAKAKQQPEAHALAG